MKRMVICLLLVNGNDGDMHAISLNFLIHMTEGCSPFLNENDKYMLTISLHFFINMMEGC